MTTPLAREGRKINTGKQLYNLHAMREVRPNHLEWETKEHTSTWNDNYSIIHL
jgi:hypothetical protein